MSDELAKPYLRVVPLGGLGHIGGNMMVFETPRDLIMVDCGVLFPTPEQPGVDYVIPDITYVLDRVDKLRGIVLTHAHEDHIGALPFVLPQLPKVPLYATRFTALLIKNKLAEHQGLRYDLREVSDRQRIVMGELEIDPLAVTHSIPDAVALCIKTPIGDIVHTGDFKIDPDPLDGRRTDTAGLAAYGDSGVTLLLSDSTNAEKEGRTFSEREVEKTLHQIIAAAEQRVFITTFASHIDRLQMVLTAAEQTGRKVITLGRSMSQNMHMGLEEGYLKARASTLAQADDFVSLPRHRVVVLASGSQGEPMSAMTRILAKKYAPIEVARGDTVIMSSRRIPGNERAIGAMLNNMARSGAIIITDHTARVHSSGHGFSGEQEEMLTLCRPRFFVPLHGEYRHMVRHAELACQTGVDSQRVAITEDGMPIEYTLQDDGDIVMTRLTKVQSGLVFVDGTGIGDVGEVVMRDRRILSESGIIICVLVMVKGRVVAGPEVATRGLVYVDENLPMLQRAGEDVVKALQALGEAADLATRQEAVRFTLRRFFKRELARKPMVIPMVIDL